MFSKHTRGHKGFRSRIELSRRALNTPTSDSARNDPRARMPIHPLGGRWEEGCGVYKADCSSCIPSRLLGILSPYPLHAHSRSFSLFVSLSLSFFSSRFSRPPVSFSSFLSSFVRRLSQRAIFIAFEYPAGGISRSDQDVAPMLP